MELDQKIFRWAWRRWRRMRSSAAAPPADPGAALVRLERFALLVAGEGVELEGTRGPGGLAGRRFLLPFDQPLFQTVDENLDFFRLRILLMARARRDLRAGHRASRAAGLDPEAAGRRAFPALMRRTCAEYPGARELYRRVRASIKKEEARDRKRRFANVRDLRGRLSGGLYDPAQAGPVLDVQADAPGEEPEHKQEMRVEAQAETELLTVDEKKIEEYTLGHNFEKLETLDDFDGAWRDLDDEEDLEDKREALEELKFKHRVRTAEQARSVVSSDSAPSVQSGETADPDFDAGVALYFDEWDQARRRYRPKYCRVLERKSIETRPGFAAEVLRERRAAHERIERRLRQAFQDLEWVRRQTGGEEPDLDALVAASADLRAGRTPDERLYRSRRKRRRDVALSFLLDLSLSTDAYVAGRRALDVEREALVIFGEALERHAFPFAIGGFFSRTRRHCEYLAIKSFRESWPAVRDRLGALQPRGYTRIGPALRRSIDLVGKMAARQRWIVLFTDGRPNDYDRYEGRYGIQDVRQAVREAEAAGVRVMAFAVDSRGRPAFREMLGAGGYRVIRRPEQLPDVLGDFFLRLLH